MPLSGPAGCMLNPVIDAATRHLAYENACYVIVARETMSPELLPGRHATRPKNPSGTPRAARRSSRPAASTWSSRSPSRRPSSTRRIDLESTIESKRWVDSAGHYARPDVFQLHWDKRPKPPLVIDD